MTDKVPLSIKEIKKWAKETFYDVTLLQSGFVIKYINIIFKNDYMAVDDFDEKPPYKVNVGTFFWPESFDEVLKKLKLQCGEAKIVRQLKNKQ